jgi:2-C-methyl-D-erythritol 4-phosphate cytidylyltransferase
MGLKSLFSNEPEPPLCTAVIVAAGSGKRMDSAVKKQFLNLLGRPVLAHTVEAVERCGLVRDIIIVAHEDDIIRVRDIVISSECEKVTDIVAGGPTRARSVEKGLMAVPGDARIVLIHDGVRPVVPPALIEAVIRDAWEHGAACLGVTPKDTIKTVDKNGFISSTLNRGELAAVQTPQAFWADIIKRAYKKDYDPDATDDCVLVEKLGVKIKVTEGSYSNIKLTAKEDTAVLNALIELNYNGEDEYERM